ncbi:hypothetical protein N0V92_013051, partial [Colletotrichum tropicale]
TTRRPSPSSSPASTAPSTSSRPSRPSRSRARRTPRSSSSPRWATSSSRGTHTRFSTRAPTSTFIWALRTASCATWACPWVRLITWTRRRTCSSRWTRLLL